MPFSYEQKMRFPERQYIDAGGVRTRYYEAGSGPVVVLVHGASLAIDARATWYKTIPALARDHRVIAPDLIGFGGTDGRHVNRIVRAQHALDFIRCLGLKNITLVGHSEGGFISLILAIQNPQLVRKVAVVTSGAAAPRLGGDADSKWMAAIKDAYDYLSGSCDTEDKFLRTNSLLTTINPPEFIRMMRKNYVSAVKRGQLQAFKDLQSASGGFAEMQEVSDRARHDYIFSRIADLKAETLLIWAAQDSTVPIERGIKFLGMLPHGEMHVFSGAAHMVMIDRSVGFNRLLAAWAKSCGKP